MAGERLLKSCRRSIRYRGCSPNPALLECVQIIQIESSENINHVQNKNVPDCAHCGQSTTAVHGEVGRRILHKKLISGVVAHALCILSGISHC